MNRAIYIILVPALLVAVGYVFVFRAMGVAPAYGRLSFALVLFVAGLWWVGKRRKEVTK